jgi:hypothetical protein
LVNELKLPENDVNQIDPKDYTPIWTIFTNPQLPHNLREASDQERQAFYRREFASFKQNMLLNDGQQPFSLVNEDYLYHLNFDDNVTAQTTEIRRQLAEALVHFQDQTDARIQQFMKLLADAARSANPKAAKPQPKPTADDANVLSAATLQQLITELKLDPQSIARLAFYTGYVPKRDQRHQYDTYQPVLVIIDDELRAFNNQLKDIVQLIKVPAGCSQRGAVAVALLEVIAKITQDKKYSIILRRFQDNPRRLANKRST